MTKNDVNFWLDCFLLVLFAVMCCVSAIVRFVFPAGTESAGWTIWGWNFDQWLTLQFGLLALLAAAILVHVMLHWSWVCGVVANKLRKRRGAAAAAAQPDGSRTLWGVGLLIVVFHAIAAGIAAAALSLRGPT